MNGYINYLVEANLGLLLFLLLYRLILNDETNFGFKRSYLLGSLVISLLFPLLKLNAFYNEIPSISHVLPSYLLPEIVITGEGTQAGNDEQQTFSIVNSIPWIYLTGLTFLSFRFLLQLARLASLIKKYPSYLWGNKYRIVEINQTFPTFSFFNHIFIGDADKFSENEKEQIIIHESVHVDKLHSIDVLFAELIKIAFWFNPIIYSYKKIFTNLHEFQADEKATENHDVKQYCNLLARVALMSADFKLANHFNNSLTLKRITMMKTIKKKMSKWKVAVIIPTIAGFFFMVACQDQVMTEAKEIVESSTMTLDMPPEVQARYDELKKANPGKIFSVIEATTEEGKKKMAKVQQDRIASINMITPTAQPGEPVRTFMIIEFNEQARQISEGTKTNDGIYTVVEESASPIGGMNTFYEFVSQNLKYPQDAKKEGISGKVFVEFVIETDGSLTNFVVLKGVDPRIDNEAIRVLKLASKWEPAKQQGVTVRQKLVLPVVFASDLGRTTVESVERNDAAIQTKITSSKVNGKTLLRGSITDASGKPLAGAHVILKGTAIGTVSGADGTFQIETADSKGELAFSYVGYKTEIKSF